MVLVLEEGTIDARIVRLLMEMYPCTVRDLERELRARADVLDRALKGLATRGVVELDPIPGRTYVRLLRSDFSFVGRKESQRKRVKHHGRKPETPKDYDGPMFG